MPNQQYTYAFTANSDEGLTLEGEFVCATLNLLDARAAFAAIYPTLKLGYMAKACVIDPNIRPAIDPELREHLDTIEDEDALHFQIEMAEDDIQAMLTTRDDKIAELEAKLAAVPVESIMLLLALAIGYPFDTTNSGGNHKALRDVRRYMANTPHTTFLDINL